jgi:nitroimidazol reductase NimA-like FMN-containing flavoprotein (pyridoxamine 5'-phosphate oxidase superfamily)
MPEYHLHNRPEREILDRVEVLRLLKAGKYAVLSLCRDNEPYVVTLSYGYDEEANALYFHCAKEGLKLDFIRANPLVCGTVIEDGGYISGECGHNYKTVVFQGVIQIISDIAEMQRAMKVLLTHLESDAEVIKKKQSLPPSAYNKMLILKLPITHLHGKAGR